MNDSIKDDTENLADPQEEEGVPTSSGVVAARSKAKAKLQPRESIGTTTIPLCERKWIDIEPSKQDLESYDLSKKVVNLLRLKMNRWPQRDGKLYLCCAFFGPQSHEGSLNMSVDLQSRSRGSPLRVVSYFQRLMDGRRATGIAMDYCQVASHSFHVASDKVRVGSKSNDDAQYTWESVAGGSFIVRKDTEMVYGAAKRGMKIPRSWREHLPESVEERRLFSAWLFVPRRAPFSRYFPWWIPW